jgi:hypothetical protein
VLTGGDTGRITGVERVPVIDQTAYRSQAKFVSPRAGLLHK